MDAEGRVAPEVPMSTPKADRAWRETDLESALLQSDDQLGIHLQSPIDPADLAVLALVGVPWFGNRHALARAKTLFLWVKAWIQLGLPTKAPPRVREPLLSH